MIVEQLDALLRGEGVEEKEGAAEVATSRLLRTFGYKIHSGSFERDKGTLYPSDAGKCPRKLQYATNGMPAEPTLPEAQFKMMAGDLLELAAVYMLKHAPGIEISGNNEKFDFMIGGKPRRGGVDGFIRVRKRNGKWSKRSLLEVKSMSKYGFKFAVEKGVEDTFGYLSQVEVYMRQCLADKKISPPGSCFFLLFDRDSMHFAEQKFSYTGEYAKAADERFKMVEEFTKKKKMIPRPYTLEANNKLPLQCSYCDYKFGCWGSPHVRVTFDSNGEPVYPREMKEVVTKRIERGKPVWYVTAA